MPRKNAYAGRAMGFKVPGFTKAVKRIINKTVPKAEKKQIELTVTDASIDVAGAIVQLSAIAQGDEVFNRSGNDIVLDYMNVNATFSNAYNGTAVGQAALLRCIFFQDTELGSSANTPTVTQVLTTANPNSSLNPDYAGRFKIIKDWVFTINSTVNAAVSGGTGGDPVPFRVHKKFYHKFKGKYRKCEFTGGTNTDVQNNHVYILYVSDVDELGTIYVDYKLGYFDP